MLERWRAHALIRLCADMQTIVFTTEKGGSGKSTLTCNLAVAAMQAGEKVLALDLSAGGSASAFEGCSGFEPMFNMAGS
jgi:putative protein kinase ArgK-like GTPase of G3E family